MYIDKLDLDLNQLLIEFIEEERDFLEVDASEPAISNKLRIYISVMFIKYG
jgi:hypothetical protein